MCCQYSSTINSDEVGDIRMFATEIIVLHALFSDQCMNYGGMDQHLMLLSVH